MLVRAATVDRDMLQTLGVDVRRLFTIVFGVGTALAGLAGGQQRMLAIARTLMGNPDLILLDEPSEGLAPLVVEQLLSQLKALKLTGLSILLSEQNLKFSLELADRVFIIEKGEIRYRGDVATLRTNTDFVQKYLVV